MSLKRVQPAERLYRTTGLGRYVHSKKLGIDMTCTVDHSHNAIDFEYPVGCDSVLTAVLDQKRYWFWGDTQAIHYPLGGSFHMTGATTDVAYPNVDTQPPVYDFFRGLAPIRAEPSISRGLTQRRFQGIRIQLRDTITTRFSIDSIWIHWDYPRVQQGQFSRLLG
jgi:hypothetical protein